MAASIATHRALGPELRNRAAVTNVGLPAGGIGGQVPREVDFGSGNACGEPLR